jgi:DNA-binding transcriptional regulator YiaG
LGGVRHIGGRLLRPWTPNNGYPHVSLKHPRTGKPITKAVHVLACRAFHGRRPTCRHEVRHRDGSKINNKSSNLCWATRSENQRDRVNHGTSNRGERPGCVKLSEYEVKMIRELARIPPDVFARQLNVAVYTIQAIRRRKTWAWLK